MTTSTASPYLPLAEARHLFPSSRGEGPVHVASITRWIKTGAKAADGSRVRLQAIRSPSGWKVSREAIGAFLRALTAMALGDEAEPAAPSPPADLPMSAARRRELERVDDDLDKWLGPIGGPIPSRRPTSRVS